MVGPYLYDTYILNFLACKGKNDFKRVADEGGSDNDDDVGDDDDDDDDDDDGGDDDRYESKIH